MKQRIKYLIPFLPTLPLIFLTGCTMNDVIRNPVVMVIIVIIAVYVAFKMQKK